MTFAKERWIWIVSGTLIVIAGSTGIYIIVRRRANRLSSTSL
jgi:hypothetical protein